MIKESAKDSKLKLWGMDDRSKLNVIFLSFFLGKAAKKERIQRFIIKNIIQNLQDQR